MAKFPSKWAANICEALDRSAINFGECGKDRLHGHGLVDAMAAANFLETGQASPEESDCINTITTIKTNDWGTYCLSLHPTWMAHVGMIDDDVKFSSLQQRSVPINSGIIMYCLLLHV
jgi:hypothetical protein